MLSKSLLAGAASEQRSEEAWRAGDVVTEVEPQRWSPEVNSRGWTGKKMGEGCAQRGASV